MFLGLLAATLQVAEARELDSTTSVGVEADAARQSAEPAATQGSQVGEGEGAPEQEPEAMPNRAEPWTPRIFPRPGAVPWETPGGPADAILVVPFASEAAGGGTEGNPAAAEAERRARAISGVPLELRTPEEDFSARLGSQAARGGGVLGRFDGLAASKLLGESARIDLLGGFPLAASDDARFDPERSFYALSIDVAPLEESVTGRIFGVQQRVGDSGERRAVGGELGVDHARGFGLVTVDYDLGFRDVGAVSLLTSTQLGEQTTLNALVDARRYSGAPAAFSILQAQAPRSVAQLFERLAQSEVRAPSFAGDAQVRTFKLGASRQLGTALRLSADVSLEESLAGEILSGRSAPAAAEKLDYSVRAVWKDLLIEQSSTSAALRVGETADARRYSGSLVGQYPVLQNLRMGPDVALEFFEVDQRLTYKPSMRFEYLRDRFRIDLRLGVEIQDLGRGREADERSALFYRFGYRYDF